MLYRKVPKTGEELSILGFGAMCLPTCEDGSIDEDRAIAQMRHAIDNGVNYVDTAWPYHDGQSEAAVAKALHDGYREKVNIADKLPQWLVKTREDMDTLLNDQLERLGVDCIDYYLVHAIEWNSWQRLEGLGITEFLNQALADGRIRNAGFSFHGVTEDFKKIVDAFPWTFCQIRYNLLNQENQAGTAGVKYAASKDLAVMVMEPLRRGDLGKPEAPAPVQELWDTASVRRTPAEWALRWLWNDPKITVVLSDMSEEAHIEENLAVANQGRTYSLTQKELGIIDRVATKYSELMQVGCDGCSFCMPCPAAVRIPWCFEQYNSARMFTEKEDATRSWYALTLSNEFAGKSAYASQCNNCGECLRHCPRKINIPEKLAEVSEYFENTDMQAVVDGFMQIQAQ